MTKKICGVCTTVLSLSLHETKPLQFKPCRNHLTQPPGTEWRKSCSNTIMIELQKRCNLTALFFFFFFCTRVGTQKLYKREKKPGMRQEGRSRSTDQNTLGITGVTCNYFIALKIPELLVSVYRARARQGRKLQPLDLAPNAPQSRTAWKLLQSSGGLQTIGCLLFSPPILDLPSHPLHPGHQTLPAIHPSTH